MNGEPEPAAAPEEPARGLALRGALWTLAGLALLSLLPYLWPAQADSEAAGRGPELGVMSLFMLSMFGFPLGFPVAALTAKNATGYGNAFRKGVIALSGMVGYNLLVMAYCAVSLTFFPYHPSLPSESAFVFWFGFTGAAGFAVCGGLGGMARYHVLGVKKKPEDKPGA